MVTFSGCCDVGGMGGGEGVGDGEGAGSGGGIGGSGVGTGGVTAGLQADSNTTDSINRANICHFMIIPKTDIIFFI